MIVQQPYSVPNLTTALTVSLQQLENHLLERQPQIKAWLRSEWLKTPAPFYTSVDLRNASFKVAAVERVCPVSQRVLIIPENHTHNIFYFESLAKLAAARDIHQRG